VARVLFRLGDWLSAEIAVGCVAGSHPLPDLAADAGPSWKQPVPCQNSPLAADQQT
jgi:hypothetical protein